MSRNSLGNEEGLSDGGTACASALTLEEKVEGQCGWSIGKKGVQSEGKEPGVAVWGPVMKFVDCYAK